MTAVSSPDPLHYGSAVYDIEFNGGPLFVVYVEPRKKAGHKICVRCRE